MAFEIQQQIQDQWCWAAVAASVSAYYSPRSSWSQCEVATYVLGRSCCSNPERYNFAAYLQDALQVIAKLRGIVLRNLPFEDIHAELLCGRPVAARIGWFGGGGHFVVIRGCHESEGVQFLNIADPFHANSIQVYQEFCDSYLGLGHWTDTFLIGHVGTGPV